MPKVSEGVARFGERPSSMMRMRYLCAAIALCILASCRDSTSPPAPTTIVLSPATVGLDAIGATQTVTATVVDQYDQPMLNVPVTWTSSASTVAAVAPA